MQKQRQDSRHEIPQKTINLNTLVEQVNTHLKSYRELNTKCAEETIKYIQNVTYPHFIGMSHEHLSCLEPQKETTKTDQLPGFRVILSTKRNKANFNTPLVRECNGAVLMIEQMPEYFPKCRLLTRPAHDCNPNVHNPSLINNSIRNGLYDIFRIDDGTTVNISYVQRSPTQRGVWVFSSKNALDLANVQWRDRVYNEILDEVFKKYPGFSLDKLNPLRTYTIGFRHPAYHPFSGTPDVRAWFIQSADVQSGEIFTSEPIGIPTQERARINVQGGLFWQSMIDSAGNSLDEYVHSVKNNAPVRPFFGYILRSKDRERTKGYSDILIESSLMNEIRKAIYQAPYIPNKNTLAEFKQNFKQTSFVQIESYLDAKKRTLYEILFPTWVNLYEQFDRIVNLSVNQTYELLTADPHGSNWVSSEPPTAVDKFVVAFGPIAGMHVSTDNEETAKRLIRSLVVRPKYVDQFLQIFGEVFKA